MRKPRAAKPAPNAGHRARLAERPPWKSERRILRLIASWEHVSRLIAGGYEPDRHDLAFLLRLGEPVPPGVQNYLADLLDRPPVSKGRPKKQPGQIEADRFKAAVELFATINTIRNDANISVAKACASYAAFRKTGTAQSVERQYWDAKKRLVAALPPNTFLTDKDYLAWEDKNPKNSEK
jgi:hypothetical protein